MYKYKTKGDVNYMIPGVGVAVNGIIESRFPIENPNLELVESPQEAKAPAATHLNGIAPQDEQPTPNQSNAAAESEQQ